MSTFVLKNNKSNKCLAIPDGIPNMDKPGHPVPNASWYIIQRECDGGKNQEWEMIESRIKHKHSNNKCITSNVRVNGGKFFIHGCHNWDHQDQKFTFDNTIGLAYSASSKLDDASHWLPQIHSVQAWSVSQRYPTPGTEWINIKFPKQKVKNVLTRGRANAAQWVKTFQLAYKNDANEWVDMGKKIGNNDQNTLKRTALNVITNEIQLTIWDWYDYISMRVGVEFEEIDHSENILQYQAGRCLTAAEDGNIIQMKCDPVSRNQRWNRKFNKPNTVNIPKLKTSNTTKGLVDKCKAFPNKLKEKLEELVTGIINEVTNAFKKVAEDIKKMLSKISIPIKKKLIHNFLDVFTAFSSVIEKILEVFKPLLFFFGINTILIILAPFFTIVAFVSVIGFLIGFNPLYFTLTMLVIVFGFVGLLLSDIAYFTSTIAKKFISLVGLFFGNLFANLIPFGTISEAVRGAFSDIKIIGDVKPIKIILSAFKKIFDTLCGAIDKVDTGINKIKKTLEKELKPIEKLINTFHKIVSGAFGVFSDIGGAIISGYNSVVEFTGQALHAASGQLAACFGTHCCRSRRAPCFPKAWETCTYCTAVKSNCGGPCIGF